MTKIYFNRLPVTTIDGETREEEWAENIGNIFFRIANNVGEHDLAVKIYHEGTDGTELTDKEVRILKAKLPELRYFLQVAIKEVLGDQPKAQEEMIG